MACSPSGLWPFLGFVTRENTPLFLHRQSTTFGYTSILKGILVEKLWSLINQSHSPIEPESALEGHWQNTDHFHLE